MNATSVDIKDMLVAEAALELVFATNLFIGKEPSLPDSAVTLYDTTGLPSQLTMDGDERFESPSFQVRVRGIDYLTVYALSQIIKDSLHGRAQEPWNGTLYTVIVCISGPAMLEWDINNRVTFIINFNTQRRSL